eukprot:1709131-Alexandrium_andersonii.AAC.1
MLVVARHQGSTPAWAPLRHLLQGPRTLTAERPPALPAAKQRGLAPFLRYGAPLPLRGFARVRGE